VSDFRDGDGNEFLDCFGAAPREFLERKGFGRSIQPGARPAVIVIDLSKAFTDPTSDVGADLDLVVRNTRRILDRARRAAVPIFFFRIAYRHDLSDAGIIYAKQPAVACLTEGSEAVEIDERLAPRADEPIITKKAASPFFGTNLAASLIRLGIDTLILTGCSTSGCIRAAAVDGYSYGYRLLVPADCVGDRTIEAHEANLFDIQVKMGEVVDVDYVLRYLGSLSSGTGCGDVPVRDGDRHSQFQPK
jgi:nicotinamidase-related amidase